ncbi:MAG: hypothetical protein PVG71_15290 [Anaerolineae bacterium]|jgi:hypothetical protein
MSKGWRAFRTGVSRVLRHPWLLAVMVGVSLLTAVLAAAPAAGALLGPAFRPAIRDVLDGVDAWMVVEAVSTPPVEEGVAAFAQGWGQVATLALVTAGSLLMLTWMATSFLSGGTLLTYANGGKRRWRDFVRACWRWFGGVLLLGAVQAVGSLLGFVLMLVGVLAGAIAVGGWTTWLSIPLMAFLALLWLAVGEITRLVMVIDGRRNIVRALRRAVRFVLRRPLQVATLYALSLLSLGILQALYHWAWVPLLPRQWCVLGFVVHQAFVGLWLSIRLSRWAGGIALYRSSD